MKLQEYDVVRLLKPVPEHKLQAGSVGAVVGVYTSPTAYEVEFADANGVTIALLTLQSDDLEKIDVPAS